MDAAEIIKSLENLYLSYGYPVVFLSALIEISPMGWTIPGGLILAGGGFYSYGGNISLLTILVAGWLGSWFTFFLAYLIGNKTGMWLVKRLKQEKNAERAKILLKRHGGAILITSMMANLTRFWVAYVAGSQNYSLFKFTFYSGAASLTWSSLMVIIGYLAGSEREKLETGVARLGIIGWLFLLIALAVIYWKTKKEYEEFKEGNISKSSINRKSKTSNK